MLSKNVGIDSSGDGGCGGNSGGGSSDKGGSFDSCGGDLYFCFDYEGEEENEDKG